MSTRGKRLLKHIVKRLPWVDKEALLLETLAAVEEQLRLAITVSDVLKDCGAERVRLRHTLTKIQKMQWNLEHPDRRRGPTWEERFQAWAQARKTAS